MGSPAVESNGQDTFIPDPVQHPAVLVVRVPNDEEGGEQLRVVDLNGIDPLAVPTVLRLAATMKESQLLGS